MAEDLGVDAWRGRVQAQLDEHQRRFSEVDLWRRDIERRVEPLSVMSMQLTNVARDVQEIRDWWDEFRRQGLTVAATGESKTGMSRASTIALISIAITVALALMTIAVSLIAIVARGGH